MRPYTLPSLNVDRNPKSEMAISRHFSMKIWNRIDESLSFFKAFQMVITIGPRTSKIAPRSSRGGGGVGVGGLIALIGLIRPYKAHLLDPTRWTLGSRSTFKERSV